MISKSGKIVSKLKSKSGKTRQEPLLAMWRQAVSEAAAELKVKYTIPRKGTPFYTLSRQKYDALISALDLYQTEGDSTTDYSSSESDE